MKTTKNVHEELRIARTEIRDLQMAAARRQPCVSGHVSDVQRGNTRAANHAA